MRGARFGLEFCSELAVGLGLAGLLVGCGSGGRGAHATVPTGVLTHGPFEVVAATRQISAGGFPNTGGNPFLTRPVSDFRLRWRGQAVRAPSGGTNFWVILRLLDAPRPTVLLVTTGFILVNEDADGKLQFTALNCQSSSTAETQWLDSDAGQPGSVRTYGIGAVVDLDAGTALRGGRWLRLGSACILDVSTLKTHQVAPWVPHRPGVPITSISREGDAARAFSPSRTKYVLAASGPDYNDPERRKLYGLLEVDIASGIAREIRMDRRRFRFIDFADIGPQWIAQHFHWQTDARGAEQLQPRAQFPLWAWRSRLIEIRPGVWQLEMHHLDSAFLPELRRIIAAEPTTQISAASAGGAPGFNLKLQGCNFAVRDFGRPGGDRRMSIFVDSSAQNASTPQCESAIRLLAQRIDAELATGRHDGLLRLP